MRLAAALGWPGWAVALLILGILGGVYLLWLLLEPMWLERTEYHLKPTDPTAETTVLKLRFFSDYHAGLRRVRLPKILEALTDIRTDGVFFGGDLSSSEADKPKGLTEFRQIAGTLRDRHGQTLYGVRGNHDASLGVEEARAHGFEPMINACILVTDDAGLDWVVAGEDDLRIGTPDAARALTTPYRPWVLAEADRTGTDPDTLTDTLTRRIRAVPPGRRVVIGHNPDQILHLTDADCGFFLSGHFHGGQIRLPFRIEYTLLRQERLIDEGITQGPFVRNGVRGFISRGVGCVLFPFRFLARPEISTLYLYGPTDRADR